MKTNNYKNLPKYLLVLLFLFTSAIYVVDHVWGDADGRFEGFRYLILWKISTFLFILLILSVIIKSKISWLQNLSLTLFSVALVVWVLEFTCGKLMEFEGQNRVTDQIVGPDYPKTVDENLGYKLPANGQFEFKKQFNSDIVFDVDFKTDENHLRFFELDSTVSPDKHAIFFGCSYTFGEGLPDTAIIPYRFYEHHKDHRPYNFGYSAYGPHQMLARLQEGKLKEIVEEKKGLAFYTFIPDHFRRAIPGTSSFVNHDGNGPWFENEDGKMVRKGLFKDISGLQLLFYKTILKSNFFRYFNIAYPFQYNEKHHKYMADMLISSAQLYEQQFDSEHFYVIFYPSDFDHSPLKKHLDAAEVKYFDYAQLFDPKKEQYIIKHDGHPSAIATKVLVDQLLKDLKKRKNS